MRRAKSRIIETGFQCICAIPFHQKHVFPVKLCFCFKFQHNSSVASLIRDDAIFLDSDGILNFVLEACACLEISQCSSVTCSMGDSVAPQSLSSYARTPPTQVDALFCSFHNLPSLPPFCDAAASRRAASSGIRLISGRIFKLSSIILNGRRSELFLPPLPRNIAESSWRSPQFITIKRRAWWLFQMILIAKFCHKSIKITLRAMRTKVNQRHE